MAEIPATSKGFVALVDESLATNMTVDKAILNEVAKLKTQIDYYCHRGDKNVAEKIMNRAIAIPRIGEPEREYAIEV